MIALALFLLAAPLCAQAPNAWSPVFDAVRAHGRYSPPDGMIPGTMGLEKIEGAREQTHLSNYVNLWGGKNPDGSFGAYEASLVSENWVLESDGKFHIDQWSFVLDMDGAPRVGRARHGGLIEDLSGRVYDSWTDAADESDPKFKAKLDSLLALWNAFQP